MEKSYYSQNKNETDFEQVDKINGNELIEMMNMQEQMERNKESS